MKAMNLLFLQWHPASGASVECRFWVQTQLFKNIYLFIYLAVLGIHCGMWSLYLHYMGSSFLTRDPAQAPYIRSEES